MKYLATLIALLVLAMGLFTGCGVSKDSYNAAVKEASDLKDQLSVVQTALSAAQDDINSKKSEISSLQSEITGYQSQITEIQSQIPPLQSQLATANAEITLLQNDKTRLQNIADLSLYLVEADNVTISMTTSVKVPIVSFTADFAGYIVVSGTSSSFYGVIFVTDSFAGFPYNDIQYNFGKGATLIIPVLPGTINVQFAVTQFSELVMATISVIYYF
jgi:hypothetical protein